MDKKIVKDIKKFALIGNIALSVFVTLLMGVGLGLLLDYFFETNYWVIICSIFFLIAAIVNFIKSIIKVSKMQ